MLTVFSVIPACQPEEASAGNTNLAKSWHSELFRRWMLELIQANHVSSLFIPAPHSSSHSNMSKMASAPSTTDRRPYWAIQLDSPPKRNLNAPRPRDPPGYTASSSSKVNLLFPSILISRLRTQPCASVKPPNLPSLANHPPMPKQIP